MTASLDAAEVTEDWVTDVGSALVETDESVDDFASLIVYHSHSDNTNKLINQSCNLRKVLSFLVMVSTCE